jgi:2-methylisocitrate lyase-like PEP mutase family enzyme
MGPRLCGWRTDTWTEVVAAAAQIVRAAQVPVTADIEAGYGDTPDAVMNSVAEIIGAGAVGVNLEDGTPRGAAPIPQYCRCS